MVFGKCNVEILKIELVGNYVVCIYFDDMYNFGIYFWFYFYELVIECLKYWGGYL